MELVFAMQWVCICAHMCMIYSLIHMPVTPKLHLLRIWTTLLPTRFSGQNGGGSRGFSPALRSAMAPSATSRLLLTWENRAISQHRLSCPANWELPKAKTISIWVFIVKMVSNTQQALSKHKSKWQFKFSTFSTACVPRTIMQRTEWTRGSISCQSASYVSLSATYQHKHFLACRTLRGLPSGFPDFPLLQQLATYNTMTSILHDL